MNLEVFRALSWLSAPCVCHSLMGVSQSEWPARLVFSARNVSGASRHCLKHWKACRSLFGASLTVLPLSCDLDAKEKKKKFQSGYWSPAHMAALSNRCFSFVLLQSLSSEAQSQRGDSWCEPSCYSQQTERRLQVENKHEPGSVLVDFLLLRYDKAVEEDMTDGTDCVLLYVILYIGARGLGLCFLLHTQQPAHFHPKWKAGITLNAPASLESFTSAAKCASKREMRSHFSINGRRWRCSLPWFDAPFNHGKKKGGKHFTAHLPDLITPLPAWSEVTQHHSVWLWVCFPCKRFLLFFFLEIQISVLGLCDNKEWGITQNPDLNTRKRVFSATAWQHALKPWVM